MIRVQEDPAPYVVVVERQDQDVACKEKCYLVIDEEFPSGTKKIRMALALQREACRFAKMEAKLWAEQFGGRVVRLVKRKSTAGAERERIEIRDGTQRVSSLYQARSAPTVNFRQRVKTLIARLFLTWVYDRKFWRVVTLEGRSFRRDELDDLSRAFGEETEG